MQHRQRGHGCADVDDSDRCSVFNLPLGLDQLKRPLHGVGFDIDNLGHQIGQLQGFNTGFYGFPATGRQQYVDLIGSASGGTLHLKIYGNFIQGVGNILIRLESELGLHVIFIEPHRHRQGLCDDR